MEPIRLFPIIVLLSLVTVEYGGWALLGFLTGHGTLGPFREQFFRDQQRFRPDQRTIVVAPSVVVVSPGRCWQDGYWSYQWVPQSYSYSAWVPGQWSPDGGWIEGHYEPAWYNGGYYQPLWVAGYWTGC